eukprot:9440960-Alexandrium_andersonii.AAC.1
MVHAVSVGTRGGTKRNPGRPAGNPLWLGKGELETHLVAATQETLIAEGGSGPDRREESGRLGQGAPS